MALKTGSVVEIWRWEEVRYDECLVGIQSMKSRCTFWVKYPNGRLEEVDFSKETWRYKVPKAANTPVAQSAPSEDSCDFESALDGSGSSSSFIVEGEGEDGYDDSNSRGNRKDEDSGDTAGRKTKKEKGRCLLV